MFVWACGGDGERGFQERWHQFANSLCPHVLILPLFFDKRTQLLCRNGGWKSLRRMQQQIPLLLLFSSFSFHPFPRIPWLKNMLCSPFPPFCICVPPPSSCLVRLQVVWQQDLQKRTCAGNTPWLTWLLRVGNWQNWHVKTRLFCYLGSGYLQKHLLFCSYWKIVGLVIA